MIGESKNDCQVFEKLVYPKIKDKSADVSFLDAGGVEQIKYPYFLLKELQIPFTLVVDRDFFFPYINNNKLNESRTEATGLPKYSDILKNNDVLKDIFKHPIEQNKICQFHNEGYRKFFEYIKRYNILSMMYCLEMDLTCSEKARNKYYELLNVMPANKNQKFLLVENTSAIKKIDKILKILEVIPQTSYPESYLKIRNTIVENINHSIL